MKNKGELIYPEFARLPESRKWQLYGESPYWGAHAIGTLMGIILIGAGLSFIPYILTFGEGWLSTLAYSLLFIFFGAIFMQYVIGTLFWRSEPSLYENGILWFPDEDRESFLQLHTRKFIPFSEIDRILINIPEDFLIEKVIEMTKDNIDDETTIEEVIRENRRYTRDKMFILMKDGTEEYYWKEDIKDIDKLKRTFQMYGVKVV